MATPAQRSEWSRAGGKARARQFTPESQAAARSHVKPESLAESGRRGHAALTARLGQHWEARRLAEWRRTRPTGLQRTVQAWLDSAWLSYSTECEVVAGRAYADIVIRAADGRMLDVEADGRSFHDVNEWIGEDRPAHDCQRDDLVRAAGFVVIRLAECDIQSGAAKATLSRELGVAL